MPKRRAVYVKVRMCMRQLSSSQGKNPLWYRRGLKPLDIQQLLFAKGDLYFVLVNPKFEAPTAEMRAVLPPMVPMVAAINNSAMGGSLVRLCYMVFAGLTVCR